jgi:chromosomal replication initiator protein
MSPSKKLSSIPLEQPPSLRRQESAGASVAWTIPSFIVGEENAHLAFLFSKRQLTKLGQLSPIVFFGPSASGKTALAITLATRWSRHTDQRPLLFTTGELFARDFQEALDADDVEHFRRRHRRCRLLVIDNVDVLASKPAAQEELTATLDTMAELERPVVLTASRLPSTIRGFRPALASRFHAGFSLELALPGPDSLSRILDLLIAAGFTQR